MHAPGSFRTILPNLFQDNFATAGTPFVFIPYLSAAPGSPITFENSVSRFDLPPAYTVGGQPIFAGGSSRNVPPNTEMDVQRFQDDLAAVTPGHQIPTLNLFCHQRNFR